MKRKAFLPLLLAAALTLSGCELTQSQTVVSDLPSETSGEVSSETEPPVSSEVSSETSSEDPTPTVSPSASPSAQPSAAPTPTPKPTPTPVPLNCDPQEGVGEASFVCTGTSASVTGNGYAVAPGNVIYLLREGEYTFKGNWNGRIVVNAPELADVKITLNGFTATCANNSVIDVLSADEVKISSKNGTENFLRDTDSSVEKETDTRSKAAVYARGSLEFSGAGKLTVSSDYKHAAAATKKLTVSNGTLTFLSADCGLKGDNSVLLTGGNVTIKSNGDGIRTENVENADKGNIALSDCVLTITSAGDGINATRTVDMANATVTVTTLGSDISENRTTGSNTVAPGSKNNHNATNNTSAKGIKAGSVEAGIAATVTIRSGVLNVTSTGHAIHSTGGCSILATPKLTLSTDKKGIQVHGDLAISGGTVNILKSVEGLESEGNMSISGGNTTIHASDDGISIRLENKKLTVSGGVVDITVTGGETDGIDSTGSIYVNGGTVISRCAGNYGIDAGLNIVVTRGTVIAVGGVSKTPAGATTCNTAVMKTKNLSAGNYTLSCGGSKTAFTLGGSYTGLWISSDKLSGACTLTRDTTTVTSWTQNRKTQDVN